MAARDVGVQSMRLGAVVPFRIELEPSRCLAWLLGLVHLAGVLVVAVLELSLWVSIPLALALVAHGAGQVMRAALLLAEDSVVAVEFGHSSEVPFRTRSGIWHAGQLLGSSYVSPELTILNLKLVGAHGVRHVVICADAVDPEDLRRLRVWLRWGRHVAIAGSA